jgi:F0F1-type ATP synthase beta subunit
MARCFWESTPTGCRSRPAQPRLRCLRQGIKVVDVLVPLDRGGKAGLFGSISARVRPLLSGLLAAAMENCWTPQ